MLVSIICPYKNSAKYLPGLVKTVQGQTFTNWELLLIDDCSNDNGSDFVRSASFVDSRIKYLKAPVRSLESTTGPWWPRNYALLHARGQLIAFLDSDDFWHPQKLAKQVYLHVSEGVSISVTWCKRFSDHDLTSAGIWRPPLSFGYSDLLRYNCIPMPSVLVDRRVLSSSFLPCRHEDYLLWLTIFRANPGMQGHTIPEVLSFYRVHSGSLSFNRWRIPPWAFWVFLSHFSNNYLIAALMTLRWAIFHSRLRSSNLAALLAPLPPE